VEVLSVKPKEGSRGIMPNRDGTGPRGQGPRTGRGEGGCKGTKRGKAPRDRQGKGKNRR